jgi:hypothetical protein
MKAQPAGKAGRPTKRTAAIEQRIIDGLLAGESLRKLCEKDTTLPHRITIIHWMAADAEFATRCARARAETADLMDDRILEVAEKVEKGQLDARAGSVVISALQWRASKLEPKKYGDHKLLEHSGRLTFAELVCSAGSMAVEDGADKDQGTGE